MSQRERIEDSYPLTPLQEGMLFESLAAPEADGYVSQLSCRLGGALDAAAFKRAWQAVVDRHPALRTAFVWQNVERPLQIVGKSVGVPFEVRDLAGLPAERQAIELAGLAAAERERGFRLTRAPLLRLLLARLDDREHHLIWTQHHLILDGWSLGVVLSEVFEVYAGGVADRPPHLAPVRRFRDYVAWLASRDLAAAEAFWRRRLAGLPAPAPVAIGRIEGPPETPHGAVEERLSAEETARLEAFVRAHRLTLGTLAAGAWAQLLARYTGRGEVVFGSVVSGRPAELTGVESIVGLFINTLPARVRVAAEARALPWLAALQEDLVELRQFEHSPLHRVQKWSGLPAGQPLFDSSLAFQNLGLDRAAAAAPPGIEIGAVVAEDRPPHALSAVVTPGRQLTLRVGYDRARFTPASLERLNGHFRPLLAGLVAQGDRPLGDLPLLAPEEEAQLLGFRKGPRAEFPSAFTLHRLFERQAAATPDAIAVRSGERRLDFRELDRRADRLARRLRAGGVGPEVRVGLCVERTLPMVVGILAVLKAGGAFVPLDPGYPRERLDFLLADSGAAVLVTEARWRGRLPAFPGTVFDLDREGEAADPALPEAGCLPEVPPESAAYVIYSSGSTGRPKGVVVPHRAVVNYALEMVRQLALTPADRVLQFAALGFDVVVEELFPAWLAGAAVVLHGRDLLLAMGELEEVLVEQGVTGLEL
ncbi:MAG: hypothetical protein QOJ16_2487, partial [Acidobacteriota bacterium]|nr:hypothetical protein [Acidobacteriota bacterium]